MGMMLLVVKGGETFDMTALVETVKWSGSKSSAPRTLEFTLLDSDKHGHDRPNINVEDGMQCGFYWDGTELFRGIIERAEQKHNRRASYKAYDNAVFLSNNKDTFVYKKKTGSQIFADICGKFSLQSSVVADTGYVIPDLTKPNTTCIDAIWDALAQTYRNTGKRFYVLSRKGKLDLIARADNMIQLVLEEGSNIISYSRTMSIEELKTRVKLYSDANKVLAEAKDTAIEAKLGIRQHSESADKKLKKAKLQQTADTLLTELKAASESFKCEILGNIEVFSGVAVWINVPYLGIQQTYYVDEDTHTFTMNKHTMELTLNRTADVQGANDKV